ncbi:MAG: hypothetical protein HKL85_09740 [Acidimicrobiaceae bacterium]|nr:hypothetical protein [Acidimicrobiaceae bacterium]
MESRELTKQVNPLFMEWTLVRKQEEARWPPLFEKARSALHRWGEHAPRPAAEVASIDERVAQVRVTFQESTELGRRNNEDFARCTNEFKVTRHLRSQEKLEALARLRDECSRVVREDLAKRALILDQYEQEIGELVSYIDEQLAMAPTVQPKKD